MAYVERWERAVHGPMVAAWIRSREMGKPADAFAMLPPTGFVVDHLAAGWLFRTDALQCFLGSILTDPSSTPDKRGKALDALLDTLQDEAHRLGYTALAGTPSRPSLIARFREHGYSLVEGAAFAIRRT